jgi:hypothetical protein
MAFLADNDWDRRLLDVVLSSGFGAAELPNSGLGCLCITSSGSPHSGDLCLESSPGNTQNATTAWLT